MKKYNRIVKVKSKAQPNSHFQSQIEVLLVEEKCTVKPLFPQNFDI